MIENFREIKVACSNIFMSIFIAKAIADSWAMCLLVWLTKLMVFNLKNGKLLDENPENPSPIRTLRDLDALIEVYSSYFIHVVFILFINLFVLCYLCFCLLILLILLFSVVYAFATYLFFNSFHCSCSGSSMYFSFLSLIRNLLFMLPLFIRTLSFNCYHYFVFISVLI